MTVNTLLGYITVYNLLYTVFIALYVIIPYGIYYTMLSETTCVMKSWNCVKLGTRKWRKLVIYGVCLWIFINVYLAIVCKNSIICISQNRICSNKSPIRRFVTCNEEVLFEGRYKYLNVESLGINSSSRYMTLSLLPGARVGNLLFQTASLLGLAKKHGYIPVLREQFPLFDSFEMVDESNRSVSLSNGVEYVEKTCCIYNENLNHLHHSKNWTLKGYFQVWKYFYSADESVRKMLKFKGNIRDKVDTFLRLVSRTGVLNIGIHVRRKDFMDKINVDLGYTTAPVSYFNNSMTYFNKRFKKVQFIVASDDLVWCTENFANFSDLYFSPFDEPDLDLALLSSCDHVIISTGTFGWWGGWLSDGITVYYRGFPRAGSQLMALTNHDDYYPKHWIGLD